MTNKTWQIMFLVYGYSSLENRWTSVSIIQCSLARYEEITFRISKYTIITDHDVMVPVKVWSSRISFKIKRTWVHPVSQGMFVLHYQFKSCLFSQKPSGNKWLGALLSFNVQRHRSTLEQRNFKSFCIPHSGITVSLLYQFVSIEKVCICFCLCAVQQ